MSKIQIYYFSGTGNTFFVVDRLAKYLRELGNTVDFTSCEKVEKIDCNYDIIGIAYPIHTSTAPKIFSEFIKKMPVVNNKPLFGIVTSGYMAGDVLNYESKGLIQKGYKPFLFRNIVLANNLHLPFLCPLKVTNKRVIDKRLIKIEEKIKEIAININNRNTDIRGNNLIGKLFGVLQRSCGEIHEIKNFKGFTCSDNCIKCRWCINNCPTKNIKISSGKITFDNNCLLCMRCYNFCPFNAIQVTTKTNNISKYQRYKGPKSLGHKTPFK